MPAQQMDHLLGASHLHPNGRDVQYLDHGGRAGDGAGEHPATSVGLAVVSRDMATDSKYIMPRGDDVLSYGHVRLHHKRTVPGINTSAQSNVIRRMKRIQPSRWLSTADVVSPP